MTDAAPREVWVFFYGSYINFDVLKEVGITPRRWEVATAAGFDLRIAPRANLVRSEQHTVWGINAVATHEELTRLYTEHAQGVLGQTYLPEAILTHREDGRLLPAMTYLCDDMQPASADPEYVQRILQPARSLGFPDDYLVRIVESAQE